MDRCYTPQKIACTLKSPSTLVPFRVSSQGVSQSCSQTAFLFYTSKCACFFFSERLLLCYISHYKRETEGPLSQTQSHTPPARPHAHPAPQRARAARTPRPPWAIRPGAPPRSAQQGAWQKNKRKKCDMCHVTRGWRCGPHGGTHRPAGRFLRAPHARATDPLERRLARPSPGGTHATHT